MRPEHFLLIYQGHMCLVIPNWLGFRISFQSEGTGFYSWSLKRVTAILSGIIIDYMLTMSCPNVNGKFNMTQVLETQHFE